MRTRIIGAALPVLVTASLLLPALPASAAETALNTSVDPRFDALAVRTDGNPVGVGRAQYWGPTWWNYAEYFRESPNGLRTVRYHDKARMELSGINERNNVGDVTNGLLAVELTSGQLKQGLSPFDNEQREPADVPVAGNPRLQNPDAPGYRTFGAVATINNNGYRDPERLGQRVTAFLDRGGNISQRADLGRPETEIVQYNAVTGHNIPRVLWDFMNLRGAVIENNRVVNGPLVDWLSAMGVPITDAYWTRARVGERTTDVLVQLFERRVLTYTPDNPDGYKVEMGNIGQHYFQWRYPNMGQPWALGDIRDVPTRATWASARPGEPWQIEQDWRNTWNATFVRTSGNQETVPFSVRQSYDPALQVIYGDTRRYDGNKRQLVALSVGTLDRENPTTVDTTRVLTTDSNDYNPAISPDGTRLIFASDRVNGVPQLFMTGLQANNAPANVAQLTNTACTNQYPSFSADGRRIVWERKCGDQPWEVATGVLRYKAQYGSYFDVELADVAVIVSNAGSDARYPRIAPSGKAIAYTDYRNGNAEIYVQAIGTGEAAVRVTNTPENEEAPTWNPSGFQIAFGRQRGERWSIEAVQFFVDNTSRPIDGRISGDTARDARWPVLWR